MTVYGNGDIKTPTEIVQNDCCSTCVGTTVAGTHRTGFIQKKSYRKLRHLLRQIILVEHLAIITTQCMCIKATFIVQVRNIFLYVGLSTNAY